MARLGRAQVFPAIVRHGPTPAFVTTSLPETFTPTETFLKRVDKLFADAVALTEARVLQVNRRVAETVVLTENLTAVKVVVRAIGDSVSLTETFAKQTNKRVADTVALTEARLLSVNRRLAETVSLSETFVRTRTEALADTLGMTEALTKFITTLRGETVVLTENLGASVVPGSAPSSTPMLHMSLSIGLRIG